VCEDTSLVKNRRYGEDTGGFTPFPNVPWATHLISEPFKDFSFRLFLLLPRFAVDIENADALGRISGGLSTKPAQPLKSAK
jgi:hypothetical protein